MITRNSITQKFFHILWVKLISQKDVYRFMCQQYTSTLQESNILWLKKQRREDAVPPPPKKFHVYQGICIGKNSITNQCRKEWGLNKLLGYHWLARWKGWGTRSLSLTLYTERNSVWINNLNMKVKIHFQENIMTSEQNSLKVTKKL